jgi:starch synthase
MLHMSKLGTVLVLNQDVSGMNRFLFREIEKEWDLIIRDIPQPAVPRYVRMAQTFHPNIQSWKQRLGASMGRYYLSAACFRARSSYARKSARQHADEADIVLQISGLFNGLSAVRGPRRVAFASFNTSLAYREWRAWAPFNREKDFRQWYDLEKRFYNECEFIICTNNYVIKSFVSDYGIDPAKLHYIGYGINFDVLPDVDKNYGSKVALFVGYDFVRKGGPTVVEAFRRVRREVPDARLRIIGPATLDEEYQIEGVEYIPPIRNRSEMQRHFIEADFFVMPSICEPFGLVFLEAMACKNACIGSTNNAMPEIIDHGNTGFLIESGNVEQLYGYMKQLFEERELASAMGQAAYRRVGEQFTWSVCGKRVRTLFRSIKIDGNDAGALKNTGGTVSGIAQ